MSRLLLAALLSGAAGASAAVGAAPPARHVPTVAKSPVVGAFQPRPAGLSGVPSTLSRQVSAPGRLGGIAAYDARKGAVIGGAVINGQQGRRRS